MPKWNIWFSSYNFTSKTGSICVFTGSKMIFATLVKYGVAFRRRLGFLDNIEPRSLSFSSTNFYLPRWEVPRLGRYVYSKSSSNNMLVHCSRDSNRVSDDREKDIESRRQLPSIK